MYVSLEHFHLRGLSNPNLEWDLHFHNHCALISFSAITFLYGRTTQGRVQEDNLSTAILTTFGLRGT
jgi:hypothetical protein